MGRAAYENTQRWFERRCDQVAGGGLKVVRFVGLRCTAGPLTTLNQALEQNIRNALAAVRGAAPAPAPPPPPSSSPAPPRRRDCAGPPEVLQEFGFECCELSPVGLKPVLHTLGYSVHLTTLVLTGGSLLDESLVHVAVLLRRSRSLRRVDLSDNNAFIDGGAFWHAVAASGVEHLAVGGNLGGADALRDLAAASPQLRCLTSLDMRRCGVDAAAGAALRTVLRADTALRVLDLSGNTLGGGVGASGAASGLAGNPSLLTLDLSDNSLTHEDVEALAGGVAQNEVLTVLRLHGGSNAVPRAAWERVVARCRVNARAKEHRQHRTRREQPTAQRSLVPSPPTSPKAFVRPVAVVGAAVKEGTAVVAHGLSDPAYAALNGTVGVTQGPVLGSKVPKVEVRFPAPVNEVLLPLSNLRPLQAQRCPRTVLYAPPLVRYRVPDYVAW